MFAAISEDEALNLLLKSDESWNEVRHQSRQFIRHSRTSTLQPFLHRLSTTLDQISFPAKRYRAFAALNFFWDVPLQSHERIMRLLSFDQEEELKCLALRTLALLPSRWDGYAELQDALKAVDTWSETYLRQKKHQRETERAERRSLEVEEQSLSQIQAMWARRIGLETVNELTLTPQNARAGLVHSNKDVRTVALGAISTYWPAVGREISHEIVAMLEGDPAPRVKSAAASTLSKLYRFESLPDLEATLFRLYNDVDNSELLRRGIYTAMLQIRGIPPRVWPISVQTASNDWIDFVDEGFVRSFSQ